MNFSSSNGFMKNANPADREKLRRAVLDLVAGRKMPKQKGPG
jgi:hypothetical protein